MNAVMLALALLATGTSSAPSPTPTRESGVPPGWIPASAPAAGQVPAAIPEPAPTATPTPVPLPARASATTGNATVEAAVTPEFATVGDLVDWEVRIDSADSYAVAAPALMVDPAPLDVRESFQLIEESVAGGRAIRRFRARVAAFETGSHALPDAEIELQGPGVSERIKLPSIALAIRSVLPAAATPALKGAKGVFRLPDWSRWPLVIAGVVLILLLGLYYWRIRRPLVLAAKPSEPELGYDERALRDLKQLAASSLLKEGRVKDFHVRLSDILRIYVGARFGFDALEMTSDELHRSLRERKVDASVRDLARSLSDLADMVKFARHVPPPFENEQALASGYRLIDTTRPKAATTNVVLTGKPAPGVAEDDLQSQGRPTA